MVGATSTIPTASVVEGQLTPTVKVVRFFIAAWFVGALVAGVLRGATSAESGVNAVVDGICLAQVALAAMLVLLGGLVEGFGFGLSLGTHWPYTRNIFILALQGDPEAAHRLAATLVGVIGVVLVALAPNSATISGLVLVVVTAVLGVGTLHVLAGRLPAIVHGVHGLLAYGVFLCYLSFFVVPDIDFWPYLKATTAMHAVLLAVLLGGMTTGQRGFGTAIEAFDWPRRAAQWVVSTHVVAALAVVATLGKLMPTYPVAFYLAVGQVAVGFLLFHAVNLRPKTPGVLVAFHQGMALSITVAIIAVQASGTH
jgi:hypothetical protein